MKYELKWNVFYHDINKQKITTFNIFDHWKFAEYTQKILKEIKDKDIFAENLRRGLFYYFGSKCEYEVIITSFPTYITMKELDILNDERTLHKEKYGRDLVRINASPDTGAKIDIYTQIRNNWDVFVDYVWNSKIHRPRKKKVEEEAKE